MSCTRHRDSCGPCALRLSLTRLIALNGHRYLSTSLIQFKYFSPKNKHNGDKIQQGPDRPKVPITLVYDDLKTAVLRILSGPDREETRLRKPGFPGCSNNGAVLILSLSMNWDTSPWDREVPLLFQFCSERYERGSLLITSNLEFSRWSEVFGDPSLTTALLDRLTHHSHVLVFQGESYRFRESHNKLGKKVQKTT